MKDLATYIYDYDKQTTEFQQQAFISQVISQALHTFVVNFIKYTWNPVDAEETKRLIAYLRTYVDTVYVEESESK